MDDQPAPATTPTGTSITTESIMTTPVFSIDTDMTVRAAIQVLVGKKIGGAPVVDKNNLVVSVVSEGDLLKLAASLGLDKKISDCLSRLPRPEKLITVKREDVFTNIYRIFLSHPVHRVIVIDDHGKLQGIISRSNVLKVLVKFDAKPAAEQKAAAQPDFHPATASVTVKTKPE